MRPQHFCRSRCGVEPPIFHGQSTIFHTQKQPVDSESQWEEDVLMFRVFRPMCFNPFRHGSGVERRELRSRCDSLLARKWRPFEGWGVRHRSFVFTHTSTTQRVVYKLPRKKACSIEEPPEMGWCTSKWVLFLSRAMPSVERREARRRAPPGFR